MSHRNLNFYILLLSLYHTFSDGIIKKFQAELVKAKAPILVDLEPELLDIKPKIEIIKLEQPDTP
jgi:hypothetical protein